MLSIILIGLCSCITQENSVQQELSFSDAGDDTLVICGKVSPLAVDLEDIFVSFHSHPISSVLVH
jgi:hypothetical protein